MDAEVGRRFFSGIKNRLQTPIRSSMHQLRTRVLVFSILSVTVLGIASLYSQLNAQLFLRSMVYIFQRNSVFIDVDTRIKNISSSIEAYLSTKSSEAIKTYWAESQALYETIWSVDASPHPDRTRLLRKDIVRLVEAYLESTEVAQNAKRGRDVSAYTAAFAESEKIASYVFETINELTLNDYRQSLIQGQKFFDQLNLMQLFNVLMLGALIALAVVLGFWFSYKLTDPLSRLAEAAEAISRGDYGHPAVTYTRRDEIGILTEAFESMRQGIVRSFQDMKEKAEIENGLMEERVKNLRMKNLLKNAELAALQAQINPHFLFNTLNAGIQLAVIEDAEQTRRYMEHLADLLRHNIRRLDRSVWLNDELSSLQSYLYILRIRFSDRYSLIVDTDDTGEDIKVPAMILQPLVENCLMHGLRDRENGGWVRVEVRHEPDRVIVSVTDNGDGIPKEVVSRILETESEYSEQGLAKKPEHPDAEGADAADLPYPGAESPSAEEMLVEEPAISENGSSPIPQTSGQTESEGSSASAAIHENRHDSPSSHTGIGLGNVISRLRLFYQRSDVVEISSVPRAGTSVVLKLPRTGSEETRYVDV